MLPRNQRQEALSRTFVRVIAARAGVICGEIGQDFGFDMYLRGIVEENGEYTDSGPQLDLQLKSSTRAELRENEVVYPLEVRAYNLLRRIRPGRPCYLVLLVLPEVESQWVTQSAEELAVRRCAYWLSLEGEPPTLHSAEGFQAFPVNYIISMAI